MRNRKHGDRRPNVKGNGPRNPELRSLPGVSKSSPTRPQTIVTEFKKLAVANDAQRILVSLADTLDVAIMLKEFRNEELPGEVDDFVIQRRDGRLFAMPTQVMAELLYKAGFKEPPLILEMRQFLRSKNGRWRVVLPPSWEIRSENEGLGQ